MQTRTLNIIPEPKNIKRMAGEFVLDGGVEIIGGGAVSALTGFLASELNKRFAVKAAQGSKSGRILLELDKDARIRDQGYGLHVDKERIRIISGSEKGLFYGIQTLLMLPQKTGAGYRLPCLRISDWPDLSIRGVHVTLSASVSRLPVLNNMIKELAQHKINMLIFEYEDKFPFERHPAISSPHAFSKDQIREMVELADGNQIELIPLVDSLGHANPYLKHKKYARLKERPHSIEEMCPLNPGSLKLVQELCLDLFPFHPSRYFHIGGDEVFRLGDFCPKCKRFIREKGRSALFVEYYGKLCRWLMEQGKTPIIWGDMLIKCPEGIGQFPREVIIMDWNYHGLDSDTAPFALYEMATEDTITCLPEHIRQTFEPYWRNRHYPRRFKTYPYVKFFQDRGFKVIGASASSKRDWSGRYANNKRFSERLVSEKALGLVNTHWSGSVPIESSWYGLLACAEYSWSAYGVSRERFDNKFVSSYFGADPRKCKIRIGMEQLEKVLVLEDGCAGSMPVVLKTADRALATIKAARPFVKKNLVQAECLEILARAGRLGAWLNFLSSEAENIFMGLGGKNQYHFVDLRKHVNFGLRNKLHSNLRCLPGGRLSCRGVPFKLLDQDGNAGKSCVVLKGTQYHGREYPKKISGIRVNLKAARLYFLHSGEWVLADKKGEKIGEYRMRYDDGTEAAKEIINGKNIGDSYGKRLTLPQMEDGFVAWTGPTTPGSKTPLALAYVTYWDNLRPDKTIESIDLVSCETAVPTILAITAEIRRQTPPRIAEAQRIMQQLRELKSELAVLIRKARLNYRKFLIPPDADRLVNSALSAEANAEHIAFLLGRLAVFIKESSWKTQK